MVHSSEIPPLACLPSVEASARLGSFSAAAAELGLTHSAVSRHVSAVEAWLGTSLFDRMARGVTLTPAGQRFNRTLNEAFTLLARHAEQWRPGVTRRTVRISVVPSFARLWLLPRIATLQGDPESVRIDLRTEHRLAQFNKAETDIAIRYGSGDYEPATTWPLFAEILQPIGLRSHLNGLDERLTPERLARLPLLHDSDARSWKAWFRDTGVRYRAKPADRRFEDYDMVLDAAAAGLGVALARLPLARAFMATTELAFLSDRFVENPLAHYVVLSPEEDRDHVLELADRLKNAARADEE